MTATELLRTSIKKQIDIADEKSLKIIQAVLSINEETDWWDELSPNAKSSIEQGLKDAKEGKLTPHADVMKYYKKWL
jgi:predicted transcriptional regulator